MESLGSAAPYGFGELAKSQGISDYRKVGLFCLWIHGKLGLYGKSADLEKKRKCNKVLLQELRQYKDFESFAVNCVNSLNKELNNKEASSLIKDSLVYLRHIQRVV